MERGELALYLDGGNPLGPLASEEILNEDLFDILIEPNPEAYRFVKPNPTLVIGRRGAGKTGYLMSLEKNDRYQLAVPIGISDEFEKIVNRLSYNLGDSVKRTVETAARYWKTIIYLCVLREYHKKYSSVSNGLITAFVGTFQVLGKTIPDFLHQVYLRLAARSGDESQIISDLIASLLSGVSTDVDVLRQEVNDLLMLSKTRCIVTIDTLEDLRLHEPHYREALQGLLKAISSFNNKDGYLDIRVTLPGELGRNLHTISSNIMKDFGNFATLQWHAGDLVSLASQRYAAYLYATGHLRTSNIVDHNRLLAKRSNALAFMKEHFPDTLQNAFGITESATAFMLRHTQLSPRQVLLILQEMIVLANAKYGNPERLDEECVILGLKRVEDIVVKEVCQAFEHLYPNGLEYARFLKHEIPRCFSQQEFQRSFNRTKGLYALDPFKTDLKYHEVLKALVNMGAVGKKLRETDRYVVAEFEYFGRGDLGYGSDDVLCIHPIFNGRSAIEIKGSQTLSGKPVYPYGSDPEDEVDLLL